MVACLYSLFERLVSLFNVQSSQLPAQLLDQLLIVSDCASVNRGLACEGMTLLLDRSELLFGGCQSRRSVGHARGRLAKVLLDLSQPLFSFRMRHCVASEFPSA